MSAKGNEENLHGKFGYGLKDAVVRLRKLNVETIAQSHRGLWHIDPKTKLGPTATDLAEYDEDDAFSERKTVLQLFPIDESDFEAAKNNLSRYYRGPLLCSLTNKFDRKLKGLRE